VSRNEATGVIFDLDGTLYSVPRLFRLRVALRCGRDMGLLRHLGAVQRTLAGRLFESEAALWSEHHRLWAERSGVSLERAQRFHDERFMPAFVGVLRRVQPRPGLAELVQTLAGRGVVCCVLSDYGWVAQRLDALGLGSGLFRAHASSAQSGALKPSPRAFLQMAERFGISPSRWRVVGDRADTDGAGASAAGMRFLGVSERRVSAAGFHPWPTVLARLSDPSLGADEAPGRTGLAPG